MRTAVLAALLAAVCAAPARAAVANPDAFIYAHPGDIDSLDPAYQYDGVSFAPVSNIYEPLVFYKGESTVDLEPRLAVEVPSRANGGISSDGRTYRFKLRKGVTFHDGTVMTPEDVRYSLLRFMLLDRDGGPSALLLEPVLGVTATRDGKGALDKSLYKRAAEAVRVEGDVLTLRLAAPFAPFLSVLATWAPVVSKAWAVKNGDWDGLEASWPRFNNPSKGQLPFHAKGVGTGPFKIVTWDTRSRQVVLERHDRYWQGPAKLKRLVFRTVDEFSARKLLLSAGDADGVLVERPYLPQVKDLPGVRVRDGLPHLEITNVFLFTFKLDPSANPNIGSGKLDGDGIPPDFFSDKDVRLGFAHAFDYEAYVKEGFRGEGVQARGAVPKGVLGYDEKGPLRKLDLAAAERHLRKAWGGKVWEKGFRFAVTYQEGRSDRQLAAQILKRNLERLNPKFKVDVRGVQWSTFLTHMTAKKLPLFNARWGLDFPDPHNCAHPFLHSQGHYPMVQGYSNPKVDALVEKAVKELQAPARASLYIQAQRLAHEDVPQLYTVDAPDVRVSRAWVQNWYYNPILPVGFFHRVEKKEPTP